MDCPARYRSADSREEDLTDSLGLSTQSLVEGIKEYMLNGGESRGRTLKNPEGFGHRAVCNMSSQSWGDLGRSAPFNRVPGGAF